MNLRQIETLMRCECLTEQEVKILCAKAREILLQEGNVQRIDAPVTVCETIHKIVTNTKGLR